MGAVVAVILLMTLNQDNVYAVPSPPHKVYGKITHMKVSGSQNNDGTHIRNFATNVAPTSSKLNFNSTSVFNSEEIGNVITLTFNNISIDTGDTNSFASKFYKGQTVKTYFGKKL